MWLKKSGMFSFIPDINLIFFKFRTSESYFNSYPYCTVNPENCPKTNFPVKNVKI